MLPIPPPGEWAADGTFGWYEVGYWGVCIAAIKLFEMVGTYISKKRR